MKKILKNWRKSLIFLSVFLFGSVLLAGVVLAATTITNNQVSTRKVANNLADFTVLDFTINVDGDTTLAGTEPSGGTAISADKPGDWTQMKFYDASAGGEWNSGADWIGNDLDGDNKYTNQADVMIYDGSRDPNGAWGYGGVPTVAGTALVAIEEDDKVCTNSLTNPTCVYQLTGKTSCGAGGDVPGDLIVLIGPWGCNNGEVEGTVYGSSFFVTSASNWSFRDGGSTTYTADEQLFIERSHQGLTYSPSTDTYIAGTNPSAGTSITASKPTDWTTLKFYDKVSAGAQFNSSNDWIGLDNDGTNIFADRLNAITFNLHSDANTISPSNVSNVKLWAGNPGSGTLLGTASSFDGGGSGWYLSGLNRSLSLGQHRFYATMTLNGTASDGKTVRVYIPRYDANSNKSFDLGDSGAFLTTRHLGDVLNAASMTVDAIPPTIESIEISDTQLKLGDTATITFTFSEEVTGFATDDLTVQSGSVGALSSSAGGTVWTGTLTPSSATQLLDRRVSVNMAGLQDVAGNLGVGTSYSPYYNVDTVLPTLSSVTFSDSKLKIGDTATVTFTFSEPVTNFTNTALTIPNGTLTDVISSDGGTVWTATLTPNDGIENLTNVIVVDMTQVRDKRLTGDYNVGTGTSNSPNYEIDTIRPTLTSATFSDDQLKIGDTATVTFTFREGISGFTSADLITVNGTTTEPVSSGGDDSVWTVTFTPSNGVEDLENVITVDMTGINDKKLVTDSNAGTGTADSSNYAIDTVRPVLSTIVFADTQLKNGDTSTVTFTFSEAVTNFSNDDITTIENGALSSVSTENNVIWTATFTPTADIEDLENIITVTMTAINDIRLSGDSNTGTGTKDSPNYAIDTLRPTLVSAVFADSELKIGDTSTTTFTFSEAITGFTSADLTVANGTISEPETTDNIVWTATLTPATSIEDLTNAITVNMTGVNDMKLSGDPNTGTGSINSDNYAIDTIRPTLVITMDDYDLNIDDTALVTFTFSEKVVNFEIEGDESDVVTVENGALGDLYTDNNIVWTATFTPDPETTSMTNVIEVDLSGVDDGFLPNDFNTGEEGETASPNYRIDTVYPEFNIQYYSDNNLTNEIAGGSYLKTGTYYIKITSSEVLSSTPTISIDAEGENNDVENGVTVHVSGNNYKYTRVIVADAEAVGTELEYITVSGYDSFNNFSENINPLNEVEKGIYTDTIAPAVDAGSNKGTVSARFTQTGSANDGEFGSGVSSYSWSKVSGHYDVTFGSANDVETTITVPGGGPYVIRLTATDQAGNSSSDTFTFTWGTVPGSGLISPPSMGSGSSEQTIPLSETRVIGNLNYSGTNVLGYVDSSINFNVTVSQTKVLKNYIFKIKEVDILNKKIKLEALSGGISVILNIGETKNIDLDGDGVNDLTLTFNNLLNNRVDITFTQFKFETVKPTTDEKKEEPTTTSVDVKGVMEREREATKTISSKLTGKLSGRILLQVEENGQAWYVEPLAKERHFMGRPADAFAMMRKFGLGISDANFAKFEKSGVPAKFAGRIFIRVEANGEAYYVNPVDMKMYYLNRPADAFRIMRELALGISNNNIRQIVVAEYK